MNKLQYAATMAAQAHATQLYGTMPYIVHVTEVVRNLQKFHYDDEDILIAGFLHDIMEDVPEYFGPMKDTLYQIDLTEHPIEVYFNKNVYCLVDAVTGLGKNRKEKKASMIAKLQAYPKAIPLKMADRLANIKNCVLHNPRLLDMYKKEFTDYDTMFEESNSIMNAEIRKILLVP